MWDSFVIFPREVTDTVYIRLIVLTVLVAFAASVGCAPARQGSTARGTKAKPYDFEKERQAPELTREEVQEEPDVVEIPVTDDVLDVEEAEAPVDTTPRVIAPETSPAVMAEGFRIQVFASAAEDVAQGARRAAQARLGIAAYVVNVDGLYKVRVGDCRTREEAEAILRTCRDGDYRDAWIVACPVVVPAENQ